ncbi:MAG: hypothetical protein F4039_05845 [Gammaproteobacteria bacterium]|nr:hypothetical protein [Gammaproteobacteria bacterium]MYF53059.1 hypothetical protein [Gammaproteobacteria bacterium]MYK43590.1 hypothetical protein [Gammaproteobacteria bacterium]
MKFSNLYILVLVVVVFTLFGCGKSPSGNQCGTNEIKKLEVTDCSGSNCFVRIVELDPDAANADELSEGDEFQIPRSKLSEFIKDEIDMCLVDYNAGSFYLYDVVYDSCTHSASWSSHECTR